MTNFILGAAVAGLIAWLRARKVAKNHTETLIGIYRGYGAPDAAGRVGWYRDNRHGSPFTEPDSPWGQAG